MARPRHWNSRSPNALCSGRDGTRSAAFLEHQCHTDAQTEDAVYPTPAPLQQSLGIERRTGLPTHSVDGTCTVERPDTGWAA